MFTMHPLFFILVILPLSVAAASPLRHHLHTANYLQQSPQESIEVSRPLPLDYLTPSCTLPVLHHTFGNTVGLPAVIANYSPPAGCTWSRAVLQLSAACNGSQSDRIAGVWLSGAELLRTSTPRPSSDGTFWNVRKDVSRYASLLRSFNVSLAVMLENAIGSGNTGFYELNLTFMYYGGAGVAAADFTSTFPLSLKTEKARDNSEGVGLKNSFNLNENPSDLIIPVSASGDKGFWFKIQSESDAANKEIQIPANTYKAVIEVYVSFHGDDEFYYANPPNSYIDANHLPTKSGNGAYREIEVKIDGTSVGSVIPFPVVFPGGINPLFWKPLAPIGAFNLPSYQLELTPFLTMLLDGKKHSFQLGVNDAISYWLVDANLHLWLDGGSDEVLAGLIKYRNPDTRMQHSEQFRYLNGQAVVQGKRQARFSGWVAYSAGNFTTSVKHEFSVDNTIQFTKGGNKKFVKQQVQMITKVRVKSYSQSISNTEAENIYFLQMTTTGLPNLAKDNDLTTAKLENRLQEKKVNGQAQNIMETTQKCILSGTARTSQKYDEKDGVTCYKRRALAEDGVLRYDTAPPCHQNSSS